MSKLTRKTAVIFASGAGGTDIEQFGSKVQTGVPNYTTDPAVIQALSAWADGWSAALVSPNNSEYKQDRNAVDYVASYQIAYILEMGIPEWDSGTTYYTNSYVQNNGNVYRSLVDSNLNQTPPASGATAYWQTLYFITTGTLPTQTVLTSGSGTYTPPAGAIRLYVQMIGAGGGGGNGASAGTNGAATTFSTATAGPGLAGSNTAGGAGGSATGGTFGISGTSGSPTIHSDTTGVGVGGSGAGSFYGSGGPAGAAAVAYGAGGGGAIVAGNGGWGGGAGAYIEWLINSPAAVAYAVGGGGAGAIGAGAGAGGLIAITEFYY